MHKVLITKCKFIFFLLVFYSFFEVKSQVNLNPNPGFEIYSTCPNFGAQINLATGWNNVNLIYGNYSVGTPDYFNTCGTGGTAPPNTFAGVCSPHSGNCFAALVMYNIPYPEFREYMSIPLSCPMLSGNTYTVSFWLTNGSVPYSPYIIKNIGIHFSSSPLTQSGYAIINVIPQVEITGYSGSTNWVQYTFTVSATANWNYMTVGSFRNDAANAPLLQYSGTTGPTSKYANYFFDDFSVIGSGSSNSISSSSTVKDITCNGLSNGSATISPVGAGPFNYNWTPGSYTTSVVNGLSSGIFTVNFNDGNCSSGTATVLVNQPLALNPQLTASSYTVCKDEIVNLSSLISGGTPSYSINWNSGATSPSISATPSITSIYNYTVTDANNCIGTSSVQINVENIDADFNYTATDCSNLVTFTNTSNYLSGAVWNFGDGSSSNSLVNASNNYSVSGVYTVELVSSSPIGCKDSIERIVTIQSGIINPDFDYVIKKSNCKDSVLFINKTIGASNYNWYFGDGLSSVSSSPSHFYSAGNYSVTLVASNTTCTASISQNITLEDRTEMADIIPNVFTPNGDGINDVFDFKKIVPCGEFSFMVYNRWGILVLKSESNSAIWDGRTTSGENVVDGTYFYVIDSYTGEKVKGTVTVFR